MWGYAFLGLVSYVGWNVLMMIISVLAAIAFRRRLLADTAE